MGWDIILYDNGVKVDELNTLSNLTYNYSWCAECHDYWQPMRDYNGKTISEAIAIMETVVTRMISDGYKPIQLCDYSKEGFKPSSMLEDMLCWITSNYSKLIYMPRHWIIKLV